MSPSERIEKFLNTIKSEGKSSPSGRHWQDFWKWLDKHEPNRIEKPPVPLILAASSASDSTKHDRLREQLMFADRYGFSLEAIEWLTSLEDAFWNHSSEANWHQPFFD